jgi:predicted Zn-dependent protease
MRAGTAAISAEDHVEGPWSRAGLRFDDPIVAERLAETFYQEGERTSAVGVLTDSAAQFSEGRFPTASVDMIRRIVDDERNASALTTVAETCLRHGEPKHLVAAVRLLGIANEHNRADTHALTLLARAFEKMGLEEKARKVEAVLVEIAEEEPTLPIAVERPLT